MTRTVVGRLNGLLPIYPLNSFKVGIFVFNMARHPWEKALCPNTIGLPVVWLRSRWQRCDRAMLAIFKTRLYNHISPPPSLKNTGANGCFNMKHRETFPTNHPAVSTCAWLISSQCPCLGHSLYYQLSRSEDLIHLKVVWCWGAP